MVRTERACRRSGNEKKGGRKEGKVRSGFDASGKEEGEMEETNGSGRRLE